MYTAKKSLANLICSNLILSIQINILFSLKNLLYSFFLITLFKAEGKISTYPTSAFSNFLQKAKILFYPF